MRLISDNFSDFLGPDLAQYIGRDPVSGLFTCQKCGKSNKQKEHVRSHLETIHFAGHFLYTCELCGKTYNGKNSLNKHMSVVHRD